MTPLFRSDRPVTLIGGGDVLAVDAAAAVALAPVVSHSLAAMLAASGIGRVHVRDRGTVGAADTVVGGLSAADEGRPRTLAAADAVRRAAPEVDLRPLPPGAVPDLLVLTRPWAAVDPLLGHLHTARVPHLVATVRGEVGVVGPLVVPGRTVARAAWTYTDPTDGFTELVDHLAVMPGLVDECRVGDETVRPQEGGFYGGWVTSRVVGPFKGAPGTRGW